MDSSFQNALANHWRSTLSLDPDAIFGAEAKRIQNRNWGDRIPQPGYVGPNYRPGGLIFVSMNPGGGPNNGLGAEDLRQYEALMRLRESKPADAAKEFIALSRLLQDIMPTWKIFRVFVEPVLGYARTDFSKVAYINLLKWRTLKSSGLKTLYRLSWENHTRQQVELLAPSRVAAVGTDAGRAFQQFYNNNIQFQAIPRVIGNNIGQPGRDALAQIKEWFGSTH